MKTRLLRKISKRVRFEHVGDKYDVHQKHNDEWTLVLSSNRIHKALHRKHNAMLLSLNQMGLTGELMRRRRKRNVK